MQITSQRLDRAGFEQQPAPGTLGSPAAFDTIGIVAIASWEQSARAEDAETLAIYLDRLARIPTAFGKLVCLASLKSRLAKYHTQLFDEWLSLSLEEQCLDLQRHAFEAATTGMLPDEWLSPAAYSNLIPASATSAERELYSGNLDLLLDLLHGDVRS
jgi:hypothetical protein